MTVRDDFDRLLATWLDESAGQGGPMYLEEMLEGLERIGQRRARLSPWRWLPMDVTMPRTRIPRALPVLAMLALLLASIVAAAVLVGDRRPPAPPFGLAVTGAFIYDSGGDLFLRAEDGKISRVTSQDGVEAFGGTFSRDGNRIAYWSRPTSRFASELWVMSADGADRQKVSGDIDGPASDAGPAVDWSPTGDSVAFAAGGILYVARLDGSAPRVVSTAPIAETPAWSPDGRSLAFKATDDGRPAVFVVDLSTGDQARVSRRPGDGLSHLWPSWSPDGTAVLYHTAGDGSSDIAIASLGEAGWVERIVVGGPSVDAWPEWSNAGTRISFVRSDDRDHGAIMIAEPDGTMLRRLDSPLIGWAPHCWAPDDSTIVAVAAQRDVAIGDETDPAFVVISVDGDLALVSISTPERTGFAACSWQRRAP